MVSAVEQDIERRLQRIERILDALLLEAELQRRQIAKLLAALSKVKNYPAPAIIRVDVA